MLTGDVRPSTLDGIKRLAAQIRRERGIKHSVALDLAASAASYSNFRNAQRALRDGPAKFSGNYVLLTRYWYDVKLKRCGRETLQIDLPKPIDDICNKSRIKYARGFGDMRLAAADHILSDELAHSQDFARGQIYKAARALNFMAYTGLEPAQSSRKVSRSPIATLKFPGRDHATLWQNPATGNLVLIDEPYPGGSDNTERTMWAAQRDWRLVKTSWPGLYSPYVCDMYIVMESCFSDELDGLRAKIEAMPSPLGKGEWPGMSVPSLETFASPKATTPQDVRRARCRGTIYPAPSKNTLPYSYNLGVTQRRPAGKMGIQNHIQAGRIIKAVLRSGYATSSTEMGLGSLRSNLEDWMEMEKSRGELEGSEFFEVYYSEAAGDAEIRELAKTPDGAISMLEDLKRLLIGSYPNCAPLRRQINRIDRAVIQISQIRKPR